MGLPIYSDFGTKVQGEVIGLAYSTAYSALPVGFKLTNNDAFVTKFRPFFAHESQTIPVSQSFIRFKLGNIVDNIRIGLEGYDSGSNQLAERYELELSTIDADYDTTTDIIYRYTTGSILDETSIGDITVAQLQSQSSGIAVPYTVYLPKATDKYYGILITKNDVSYYYDDLTAPKKIVSRSVSDSNLRFYASIPQGGVIDEVTYGPFFSTGSSIENVPSFRPETKTIGAPWAFAQRFDAANVPIPTNQYLQSTHVELAYPSYAGAATGGGTGSAPPPLASSIPPNPNFVQKLRSSQGYKYTTLGVPQAGEWGYKPVIEYSYNGGGYLNLMQVYPNLFGDIYLDRSILESVLGGSKDNSTSELITSYLAPKAPNAIRAALLSVPAPPDPTNADIGTIPDDWLNDYAADYPYYPYRPETIVSSVFGGAELAALETYELSVTYQYTWTESNGQPFPAGQYTFSTAGDIASVVTSYAEFASQYTVPYPPPDITVITIPGSYDPSTGVQEPDTTVDQYVYQQGTVSMTWFYSYIKKIPFYFTKGTYSHVKMDAVTSTGNEYTPSVIICNNAKTIYYFTYSSKDNRYNPKFGVEVTCEEDGEGLNIEP